MDLKDKEIAGRARKLGVTDVTVNAARADRITLAKKNGLRAYGIFGPPGRRLQILGSKPERVQAELAKANGAGASAIRQAGLLAQREPAFGGEPSPHSIYDDALWEGNVCFVDEEAMDLAKKS